MTRHSQRAGAALRALTERDPALAALSLWCDHRDGAEGVARTSGATITYGPGFETLSAHEQIGVAAHHVLHVALRHGARMDAMQGRLGEGFDSELYAIAADAVVNEVLEQAGYAMPRPALTLRGLLLELDGTVPPARELLSLWDVDRLYIRLMQVGTDGRRASDAAKDHVRALVFEPDLDAGGQRGEAADAEEEALWRQHLSRAIAAGRQAGRGVGLIGHLLADLRPGDTPWEIVLRGLVGRALAEDARLTYRRPARRWVAMQAEARRERRPEPAFEPGRARRQDVPRVVVALDASSSIDDLRFSMFWTEIVGLIRRTTVELWVFPFDEAPGRAVRLDPVDWKGQLAAMEVRRGGGTAFPPALAAAAALGPSVIVVLTDLEGEAGEPPGRSPVIWAVPAEPATLPPFGRVLSLAR